MNTTRTVIAALAATAMILAGNGATAARTVYADASHATISEEI